MTRFRFLALQILFLSVLFSGSVHAQEQMFTGDKAPLTYEVVKAKGSVKIDADWNKAAWKKVKPLAIQKFMGPIPHFTPETEAKMIYDDDNVYVIFKVKDRYVKSVVEEYNGNVSGDACVEFFFSPDTQEPLHYFNLEVNAGGTPLIFYVTKPWTDYTKLTADDIKQIEIAHSLPAKIDPEITEPVTWTLEYRIPLSILKKFSNVTNPKPGVKWKANFYKTGSRTSNPHWLTWSYVEFAKPNFHLPEFFGTLIFK